MRAISVVILLFVAIILSAQPLGDSVIEVPPPVALSGPPPETGLASWYGPRYHGRLTANGERYNMNDLTTAHPSLPFNTIVRVRNLKRGCETVLRVNDRGPFAEVRGKDYYPRTQNRVIDVSRRAARELCFEREGLAPVEIAILIRK